MAVSQNEFVGMNLNGLDVKVPPKCEIETVHTFSGMEAEKKRVPLQSSNNANMEATKTIEK